MSAVRFELKGSPPAINIGLRGMGVRERDYTPTPG